MCLILWASSHLASGGAMARFEVITGPERRRRWSEEQKRAIVAESFAPGAVVSDVARRADISAGQIYRWRQELRGTAEFAQVLIAPAESAAANGVAPCPEPAIEVEVGKARVRIPGSIPAALAAAGIQAVARRQSPSPPP